MHGGVLFPGDWSVDNRRYAAALREAAASAGVRVVRDRVTAVLTADDLIHARKVGIEHIVEQHHRWQIQRHAGEPAQLG